MAGEQKKAPYDWRWQFRRPWTVEEYHDTLMHPATRKCHTPFGTVLLTPIDKLSGTFFEFQRRNVVYTGKVYEARFRTLLAPTKSLAAVVIAQLRAEYPELRRMR